MDDRALLRDLKAAMQETEGQAPEAKAKAIYDVLERHGASESDVFRLLGRARDRRRREITSLHERLEALIDEREDAEATADAVDRFLRRQAQ